jgi:hypothetical protein
MPPELGTPSQFCFVNAITQQFWENPWPPKKIDPTCMGLLKTQAQNFWKLPKIALTVDAAITNYLVVTKYNETCIGHNLHATLLQNLLNFGAFSREL